MKAKECADIYKANPCDNTLMEIVDSFIKEIKEIAEIRHVKYDIGFVSILSEQDRKWRAFTRLCPDIRPDGFRIMVFKHFPFLLGRWKPERIIIE